jgi:hypothetical protein
VRVELAFVEDLGHCDLLDLTTGGETLDVNDEAREEVILVSRGLWSTLASRAHVILCYPRD